MNWIITPLRVFSIILLLGITSNINLLTTQHIEQKQMNCIKNILQPCKKMLEHIKMLESMRETDTYDHDLNKVKTDPEEVKKKIDISNKVDQEPAEIKHQGGVLGNWLCFQHERLENNLGMAEIHASLCASIVRLNKYVKSECNSPDINKKLRYEEITIDASTSRIIDDKYIDSDDKKKDIMEMIEHNINILMNTPATAPYILMYNHNDNRNKDNDYLYSLLQEQNDLYLAMLKCKEININPVDEYDLSHKNLGNLEKKDPLKAYKNLGSILNNELFIKKAMENKRSHLKSYIKELFKFKRVLNSFFNKEKFGNVSTGTYIIDYDKLHNENLEILMHYDNFCVCIELLQNFFKKDYHPFEMEYAFKQGDQIKWQECHLDIKKTDQTLEDLWSLSAARHFASPVTTPQNSSITNNNINNSNNDQGNQNEPSSSRNWKNIKSTGIVLAPVGYYLYKRKTQIKKLNQSNVGNNSTE